MTQKPTPARIIPPYNILLRSIIAKFAEESGISLDTLDDLKNEQMAITEELATKIHLALGDDSPSVEFWLTLQSNYERHKLEDFQRRLRAAEDEKKQWEQERIAEVTAAINDIKTESPEELPSYRWSDLKCIAVHKLKGFGETHGFYDIEDVEVLLYGLTGMGKEKNSFLQSLSLRLIQVGMDAQICCEE